MLVITRQIKAARSLLGWEQNELAVQSGLAISTIRRLEGLRDAPISAQFETVEESLRVRTGGHSSSWANPNPGVRLRTIAN